MGRGWRLLLLELLTPSQCGDLMADQVGIARISLLALRQAYFVHAWVCIAVLGGGPGVGKNAGMGELVVQ